MYFYVFLSSLLWLHVCTFAASDQLTLAGDQTQAKKRLSFQDVISGSLRPQTTTLQWTNTGRDGSYFETNATTGDLWLAHVLEEKRELLVNGTKLNTLFKDGNNGRNVAIRDYKLQPGGDQVLVSTNYTKLYRWSGFADYFVYDPTSQSVAALDGNQSGDIRYAIWSPTGDSIAYVRGNDLYVHRNGTNTRVTSDGSPDIFNGIPDWVYEEEIFGTTNTLWYSPDGRYIAFLRFNDTEVPTYRIPYYMTGQQATAYPRELELRYPKAGQALPTVTLNLLDLNNIKSGPRELKTDAFPADNLVIGEVSWITDSHTHLAWRCFNRVQDEDKLLVLIVPQDRTFVAAERSEKNGWIDNLQSIRYVPRMNCYVYISDEDGWAHIYLQFVDGQGSLQITKGEWEVTRILYVSHDTVYYQSTEGGSTERHIFSVDLNFLGKTALVDIKKPAAYSASFSSQGGYYVLSYTGPGVPRQELYSIDDLSKPIRILQDNAKLAEKLSQYNLPTLNWTTIQHPEGFELNVLETLPPDFDSNKKYPLLLNPYGGPGSQQAQKSFHSADWWAYVASEPSLEYVIITVDGRGTGYKGKEFRSVITGNLGYFEALDQIFAAEEWRKKSYIDKKKIVIQGWSYGGYLSSKVIELNSDVISSAIITAPVSSWLFYDALYTERYMKSPVNNSGGYYTSSVHNTTGFSNARGGVLLQHGTGDDNVHFQNSAVLTDLLMSGGTAYRNQSSVVGALSDGILEPKYERYLGQESILLGQTNDDQATLHPETTAISEDPQKPVSPSKLTVQWFTDSDHGISFHGSTLFLRKQMARWLYREKRRKEVDPKENELMDAELFGSI